MNKDDEYIEGLDKIEHEMKYDTPREVEYIVKIRGRADEKSIKSI